MNSFYQEDDLEEQGKFKQILRWCVDIIVVIAVALFAVMMFGERITMSGRSMESTISNEDVILLNKLTYRFSGPERMDVIAFHNTGDESKLYIKRVVGLPGERVKISDGSLYINGTITKINGVTGNILLSGLAQEEILLGEDEYFVLGDNPDTSEDSRFANVGNVKKEQIDGKLWFRISPFTKSGFIK